MGFGFTGLPSGRDASSPSEASGESSSTAAASTPAGPRQQQGGVDSLNVSVATGILLHDLLSSARRTASAPASPAAAHA